MVTVSVGTGEEKKDFQVHKEIITRYHVSIFGKIEMEKPGSKGVFEEDTETFVGLLEWAYHGRFLDSANKIDILWKLHFFADKNELVRLLDVSMNKIVLFYKNPKSPSFPTLEQIQSGYANTKEGSGARIFLASCYLSISNVNNKKFDTKITCSDEDLAETAVKTDGLMLDVFKFTRKKGPSL